MKKLNIVIGLVLLSSIGFSQTIKDKIDKQMKDKSTMDKSARADVIIQKENPVIVDSTVRKKEIFNSSDRVYQSKKRYKAKYKKKNHSMTAD